MRSLKYDFYNIDFNHLDMNESVHIFSLKFCTNLVI